MMNKEIDLQEIINSGQLTSFFLGQKGLDFINAYSDMPTNPNLVIQHIRLHIKDTSDDCTIWEVVEKALMNLLDSHEGVWLFSYYLLGLLSASKRDNQLAICLRFSNLYSELKKSIITYQLELETDKRWTGRNYDNGLLGDILRLVNIIDQDYDSSQWVE